MSNRKSGGNGISPLFLLAAAAIFALGAFFILRTPNPMEDDAPEISYQPPARVAESPAPSKAAEPAPPAEVPEAPPVEITETPPVEAPETPPAESVEPEPPAYTYALNTNTMKIHKPGCSSVGEMSPRNLKWTHDSLEELESEGYTKCKRCF